MSTHSKKSETTSPVSSPDTATALDLLAQVLAALGLSSRAITAKQRKAATRSRKGMEKVIPTLANLSAEHGVSVPKQPTSEMTSKLDLAGQLEPVRQELVSILTLVQENIDDARGGSFNTATTLYGMLRKAAHRDVQLTSQLAPVKEFFGYRTKAAKDAHPKQKGKKAARAAEKQAAAMAAESSVPRDSAPLHPKPPEVTDGIAT